jgi:hypothetical protein
LHDQSGTREFFTFDEDNKRVIGYGMGIQSQIVNAIFKGKIVSISQDEIRFDLVVAFDNVKVGNFVLNRTAGWMSPSENENVKRDSCVPTGKRSPLDLWRLFSADQ